MGEKWGSLGLVTFIAGCIWLLFIPLFGLTFWVLSLVAFSQYYKNERMVKE